MSAEPVIPTEDRGYSVPLAAIVRLEEKRALQEDIARCQREAYLLVPAAAQYKNAFDALVKDIYSLDAILNHGRTDALSRAYERFTFRVLDGKFAEAAVISNELDAYAMQSQDRQLQRAVSSVRGSLRLLSYEMKHQDKRTNGR